MTLTPEWIRVGLELLSVVSVLFGAAFTAAKLVAKQFEIRMSERFRSLDEKLAGLDANSKREAEQWRSVDRELLNLKADLPVRFVLREDYIRNQSIIEAKLDTVAIKIEQLPKGAPHVHS